MRALRRALYAATAILLGFSASLMMAQSAQAITVDLNYGGVSFINPGNTDIGASNPAVGFTYRYQNAVTINTQVIDAIVTVKDKTNATITQIDKGGTPSQSAPDANMNSWTDVTSTSGSVTYQIDFVEGGSNTPITLQNVAIAVWDIDNKQYAQFAGITSYKMASNTVLTAITNSSGVAAGSYRFHDAGNSSSDATDQPNWVEVRYAQVNSLQIVLGATTSGAALYSIKFAPETWANAVTTTPAATPYTITYDGNTSTGGTVPASTTGTGGQTVSANTGSLVKAGYYLAGWNTAADGSGATYLPGSTIIPVADTTLYAVWVSGSQPTYTLTYDGNTNDGGTSPSSTTGYGTYPTSANSGTLTRTGYTFAGWNTAANGSGTTYQAADLINLTGNITLYAKWTSNVASYTISYDPNNPGSGTAPGATTGSGSVTTAPNSGSLSKPGYTFAGWNTAADGSGTTYQPGDALNLSGNITLFALWTPVSASSLASTGARSANNVFLSVGFFALAGGLALVAATRRAAQPKRIGRHS